MSIEDPKFASSPSSSSPSKASIPNKQDTASTQSSPLAANLLIIRDGLPHLKSLDKTVRAFFPKVKIFASSINMAIKSLEDFKIDIVFAHLGSFACSSSTEFSKIRKNFSHIKFIFFVDDKEKGVLMLPPMLGTIPIMPLPSGIDALHEILESVLTAKPEETTMSGFLDPGGLVDIIQLISTTRKNCILEVETEHGYGALAFAEGELKGAKCQKCIHRAVEHIEIEQQFGSVALFMILSWEKKLFFWVHPVEEPDFPPEMLNINTSWEFLVLENARMIDEQNNNKSLDVDISHASMDQLEAIVDFLEKPHEQDNSLDELTASLEPTSEDNLILATPMPLSVTPSTNKGTKQKPSSSSHQETQMSIVSSLKEKLPDVDYIVAMDESGLVEAASDEENAENIGAISFYTFQTLEELGNILGLGEAKEVGLDGGKERWLLAKNPTGMVACYGTVQKGSIFQAVTKFQKALGN